MDTHVLTRGARANQTTEPRGGPDSQDLELLQRVYDVCAHVLLTPKQMMGRRSRDELPSRGELIAHLKRLGLVRRGRIVAPMLMQLDECKKLKQAPSSKVPALSEAERKILARRGQTRNVDDDAHLVETARAYNCGLLTRDESLIAHAETIEDAVGVPVVDVDVFLADDSSEEPD